MEPTEQENITTAGQRKINLIWEYTQSIIAVIITLAVVTATLLKIPNETLTNGFFLIVGFYFARTNHSAIGGVGMKPFQPYIGR